MRFASLIVLPVALAAACAHAPLRTDARPKTKPEMLLVTGSRIPQRVESGSGAVPSISPLRVYDRSQLDSTGWAPDTGRALRELDPSMSQ